MTTKFNIGDRVVISKAKDAIVFRITKIDGFACTIREDRLAQNGKLYAAQQSDLSLLTKIEPNAVYLPHKGGWFWIEQLGDRTIYTGPYRTRESAETAYYDPLDE